MQLQTRATVIIDICSSSNKFIIMFFSLNINKQGGKHDFPVSYTMLYTYVESNTGNMNICSMFIQ